MIIIMIGVVDFFTHHSPPEFINIQCEQQLTDNHVKLFVNQDENLRFFGFADYDKVWVENRHEVRDIICFQEGTLTVEPDNTIDDLKEYWLPSHGGYYFTSLAHIREYSLGRQMNEIDSKWRLATRIYEPMGVGNGWKAEFTKIAALDDSGELHSVNMTFDSIGCCTGVEPGKRLENHNQYWLSKLPYATTIAGWDWLMWHVQDNPYENIYNHWRWYWRWPARILWFLFAYFIWAILPLLIPFLLVMSSLHFEFMRHVPTWLVTIVGTAATVVLGYPWMVAMLCWGYIGFIYFCIAALVILTVIFFVSFIYRADGSNDSIRCDKCGRVNSYKLVRSENVRKIQLFITEHEIINRTVHRVKGSERTVIYEVDCYGRGFINSHYISTDQYKITYYKTYAIVEYKDWKVEYDVTQSDNTYRCKCGAERFIANEETRVPTGKRTYVGNSKKKFDIEGEEQDRQLPEDSSDLYYKIVGRHQV